MYPLSKRIPSVSSSSRPKVLLSSTVMTPSLPTLSIASAIISPIAVSPAEMDAVEAICSLVSTSLETLDSSSLTRSTAASMPRLSEHGRGGGAVTGNIVGLLGDFLDQLGADLLPRVLELDLLGDGHTIVGDRGCAPLLLEHHVPALGAEGYFYGVGQLIHTAFEAAPRVLVQRDHLGCHRLQSSQAFMAGGWIEPTPATDGRPAGQSLPAGMEASSPRSCHGVVTLRGRVPTTCLALSP